MFVWLERSYEMKAIGIMTDSHSGISKEEAARFGIHVLPMPFSIDGESYYEDVTISRPEFFERMRSGAEVATSQPSPEAVLMMWDEMLQEFEQVLYLPLSSGLSGSCMTAAAMARDEKYEGRIFVVDNGRISVPLHQSLRDTWELVQTGKYDAEEIRKILEDTKENMSIYIALDTLEYLKKGGRINSAAAAVASVLNIKPVMMLSTGKLDIYQKCRGSRKARHVMIEAMKNDLSTRFREACEAGEVQLMAASSSTPEVTAEWVAQIQEAFPGMDVLCDDLSIGVSCHVGPGGLGIGCSCKPVKKQL